MGEMKVYECLVCGRVFEKRSDAEKHLKSHSLIELVQASTNPGLALTLMTRFGDDVLSSVFIRSRSFKEVLVERLRDQLD